MSTQTIDHKIEQVNASRRQTRNWRIGAAVATLAITGVCLLSLRNAGVALVREGPTHDEFVVEFRNGLTHEVTPQLKTIASRTWKEVVPLVRTEIVKLELRTPEMTEGVRREVETLRNDLESRTDSVLRGTVTESLKQRQATIQKLYADITPEKTEKIKALLLAEGERRVGNLTEVVVTPYEKTLAKIVTDLSTIRETETVAAGNQPTSRELAAVLLQLANEQFNAGPLTMQASTKKSQQFAEAK